jgi:tripartite-type tricarboxylate transporter receptor subunit TctC
MLMKRRTGLMLTVALGVAASAAQADFPTGPIELWIGFSPGGPFDILARQTAPFLEAQLGTDVIVVNRPGAGGGLMQSLLANADPDGYTIGLVSHIGLVSVLFGGDLDYTYEDFEYLGTVTFEPYTIIAGMDQPFATVEELVAEASSNPAAVIIGSTGIGTAANLALQDFARVADVDLNIIPTIGAAEMQNNVLGGHIQGGITTISFSAPLHAENQARILGVMSGERLDAHPDIPTFREAGLDLEWGVLRGFIAPAGTPPEIVEKFTQALRLVHQDPEFLALAAQANHMLEFRDGPAFRESVSAAMESLEQIWEINPWLDN